MNKLKFFLFVCALAGSFLAANTEAAVFSNSMVRFRISNGTTRVGDIDVELFDHDKPITVSNFLHYVRAGAYDRSILHSCVPGFIVQGGLYTVENPYAPALFKSMTRIVEGPAVLSEFNTGPRIGNSFGTLAMALSVTNNGTNTSALLDTAKASWFFNAADNARDLDSAYTVFGRVKAGSKLLKSFNALAEDEGIINMFGLNYQFSPCDYIAIDGVPNNGLGELPVSYRSFDCPYYSSLFNVQIILLSSRDVASPNIIITSPAANGAVTNDAVNIVATVSDNVGLASVRAYLGSSGPSAAVLDTNNNTWTATLANLAPGTNTFLVEATDTFGNRTIVSRQIFRSAMAPLTLLRSGTGTGVVLGPTNGQLLELTRHYTLTAQPDAGNLFGGWNPGGFLLDPKTTYSFEMRTNSTVIVLFNTNLFPYLKGTYTGLFHDSNQVEEQSSGFATFTISELGAYSAKVWIEGKSYPLTGTFDARTGRSVNFLVREFTNDLFVRLNLDLLGGSDRLSGTFSNIYTYSVRVTNFGTVTATFYTNKWIAQFHADRSLSSPAAPVPLAGKYTLIIPADPTSPAGPFGDGYGTVSINSKGSLTFSGSLADGTKVSQKVPISKNGDWPLYLNLYKGKGTLLSRIAFDTNAAMTDLSGLMNWFKRTQTARYHGGGFTNESTILGSRFTPPNSTTPLLNLTTAVVGFTDGNLMADFTNNVTVDAAGKVTNRDANKLSVSLSKSTGLMSGSVTPRTGGKSISFKGAVLQKQTNASGFFLGTNASGRVSIQAP